MYRVAKRRDSSSHAQFGARGASQPILSCSTKRLSRLSFVFEKRLLSSLELKVHILQPSPTLSSAVATTSARSALPSSMTFLLGLLALTLNVMSIAEIYPFDGERYCRRSFSINEKLSFLPNKHLWFAVSELLYSGLRDTYYTFNNKSNILTLTPPLEPELNYVWSRRRWDKFVYHPEYDGWSVGEKNARWFRHCGKIRR